MDLLYVFIVLVIKRVRVNNLGESQERIMKYLLEYQRITNKEVCIERAVIELLKIMMDIMHRLRVELPFRPVLNFILNSTEPLAIKIE